MTDDALYGYLGLGQSRPMAAGTALRYRSNRPAVVVVDGHGTLQAVTATATYQGGTVSTSYVMTVPP